MEQEKNILQELKQVVDDCKLPSGFISWDRVHKVMNNRYPDLSRNRNAWRMMYRNNFNEKYKVTSRIADNKYNDRKLGLYEVNDRIVHHIKKRKELHYLADLMGFTDEEFMVELTKLKLNGYNGINIWNEDGIVYVQNKQSKYATDYTFEHKGGKEVILGIVSDTHLGHNSEGLKELNMAYDYFKELGIETVLHIGDVTDGWYQHRPTSIFEQHSVGFQNQLNYVVKNYPKKDGIKTYFITGNHDFTHQMNGGANIGEVLSQYRDDMVYMGHNYAKYNLSDKASISMIHPTDGSARALSYRIQEVIDRNMSRRGEIMMLGHYHKYVSVFYKGVYGYTLPGFEHMTEFQLNNNLTADVGCLVLRIKLNEDGTIKTLSTELVMYKQY